MSLTVLVTCSLTWFLLSNVKEGLLDQRVNRVVAESVAEVEDAVNRLEASPGIGTEVDAQQRAVVDPIRERGAARGFAVALTLPYEEGQPLSYGGIVKTDDLDMRSIPDDLRRAFANDHSTAHEFTDVVSTGSEIAGVPEGPGVVVAQQLKLPADGKTYTLYFVFSLSQQSETLALVTRSVLTAGIFLAFLVGAITFVVARQVVAPVRQTREVAERLASGHLQERLQVRGEDDLARLASSFNHMASNLQRQILQLEELSRMQRRFVSDVSHELRTPLTTVRMAGDMLHDARDDMDPVTARAAELLHTEIERFELLLADLLEISRFDAGAAVLDLDDVDLVQVAHHVVEVTKPLADARNVAVLVEAPDGPGIAEADVRRVQRIVRNLVTNAIDHAEGRDIVIRIGHDASSTALTVRDHGVGLGPGGVSDGLQPVLARRPGPGPHQRRHRTGALHLAGGRASPRWLAPGLGPSRRGRPVPSHPASPLWTTAAAQPAAPGPRRRGRHAVIRRSSASFAVATAMAMALSAMALTGCVRMPSAGPVVESGVDAYTIGSNETSYQPPSPADNATRSEIVHGFLQAMRALPLSTDVSRQYLTDEASDRWEPQYTVTTFASVSLSFTGDTAVLVLNGAHGYDGHGAWLGRLGRSESTFELPMVQEHGEWRIAQAPQRLLVSESWFAENVERVQLYFLDSTSSLMVPEPAHYPAGETQLGYLVRGLLKGPGRELTGVVRSALPSGLRLAQEDVRPDEQGRLHLALRGPAGAFDGIVGDHAAAQLAWTLRQADEVDSFSISFNGRHLSFADGSSRRSVNAATLVVPYGSASVPGTFEFVDGRLRRGLPNRSTVATTGPFGSGLTPVRSVGVRLDGRSVVAVDSTGTQVYTGPVESVRLPRGGLRTVLSGRTDLLEPTTDAAGRTWLVDLTDSGAEVLMLSGRRVQTVAVAGVTGRDDVTSIQVSPDGTRLAFLAGEPSGAHTTISVARVVFDADRNARTTAAQPVGKHLQAEQPVLDMVWTTGARLGVLLDTGEEVLAVHLVAAEGAPDAFSRIQRVRARPGSSGLAMTSIPGAKSYVYSGTVVRDLDDVERPLGSLHEGADWFGYPG
ncbi:MtrAB system histidine kinase MtrB [Nocardioides yefusunii]|uniref:MtrAB system histidine kinase MtrB n=1 Tax=Nocardioides yefusunii TaxID=2500546 RepID=UPI003BB09633